MIFESPGTDNDTKLSIVRKDMSLIVPHTNCSIIDLRNFIRTKTMTYIAKLRHIFHTVVSSKNLIPSSKYSPIYAETINDNSISIHMIDNTYIQKFMAANILRPWFHLE